MVGQALSLRTGAPPVHRPKAGYHNIQLSKDIQRRPQRRRQSLHKLPVFTAMRKEQPHADHIPQKIFPPLPINHLPPTTPPIHYAPMLS